MQSDTRRVGLSSAALGAALALSLIALVVFVGVIVHELQFAADHPYRYGPAKVIAWAAGGGGLLALALALLTADALRGRRGAS